MKTSKKLKQVFVALTTSLLITGIVPGISVVTTNYPVTVEAAVKVKMSKTKIILNKGQSTTLKITGTKEKVTWRSSNKKVVVVNSKGKVIAKASGTAVITADVLGKRYSCKVTVKNASLPTTKISKTKITLNKGQSITLKITGTKEKVTWRSSNKKVAIVNSKGKVTAKSTGTATITATVSEKKYTCKVTVKNASVPVGKVPSCATKQTIYATGRSGPHTVYTGLNRLSLPSCFIYIKNLDANAKITDMKSSNPKLETFLRNDINAIGIDSNTSEDLLGMTSIISFKVAQNGKTYDLSCKINIEKQESVVSSFKIGSQNITKYCDGANTLTGLKFSKKQLVAIKMNPGYIFDYYQVLYDKNGKYESAKFKNNSYIDFTNCISFQVMYHTTKKPANYSESPNWWGGIVPTPLHNYFSIDFPQSSM